MTPITFPMELDLNESGQYPKIFKSLYDLELFYCNCSDRQAEEIEDIFSDDNISVKHLINYPAAFNIVQL